jgi:SAM-dependent methyltransferase
MSQLPDESDRYRYFLWFFNSKLPTKLVDHRKFFASSGRGFGEDAFHAMWWKITQEFSPKAMLEIGVYRGQSLSLWQLIGRESGSSPEIWGVSPLSSLGDEVSKYVDIDYEVDIAHSFSTLGLAGPNLFRGLSQDSRALRFMKSRSWDLVYVDGSHNIDVVGQDVQLAAEILRPGGLLVLDDASLYSSFIPRSFSFRGHPGPSEIASRLYSGEIFYEIGTCGHNRVFQKRAQPSTEVPNRGVAKP